MNDFIQAFNSALAQLAASYADQLSARINTVRGLLLDLTGADDPESMCDREFLEETLAVLESDFEFALGVLATTLGFETIDQMLHVAIVSQMTKAFVETLRAELDAEWEAAFYKPNFVLVEPEREYLDPTKPWPQYTNTPALPELPRHFTPPAEDEGTRYDRFLREDGTRLYSTDGGRYQERPVKKKSFLDWILSGFQNGPVL